MVWEKDSKIPSLDVKSCANPGKVVCFLHIIQCIKHVGSKQIMQEEGSIPDLAMSQEGNIAKVKH